MKEWNIKMILFYNMTSVKCSGSGSGSGSGSVVVFAILSANFLSFSEIPSVRYVFLCTSSGQGLQEALDFSKFRFVSILISFLFLENFLIC